MNAWRGKIRTSTYGSPENNVAQQGSPTQEPTAANPNRTISGDQVRMEEDVALSQVPDYSVPEPKTPDPNVSATTYGNIPFGQRINDTATYGMSKPTAEQAAGAGSRENFASGTYPPNPSIDPLPGVSAVMPKLQVQGKPAQAYAIRTKPGLTQTVIDSKWDNQEIGLGSVARPSAEEYGLSDPQSGRNPPARIPNDRGKSGSSEVFRTNVGRIPNLSLSVSGEEGNSGFIPIDNSTTLDDRYEDVKCINCNNISKTVGGGAYLGFSADFVKDLFHQLNSARCLKCGSEKGFVIVS